VPQTVTPTTQTFERRGIALSPVLVWNVRAGTADGDIDGGASLMAFRAIEHRRIALSPAPVELFQRIQTAPLHLSICHTPGTPVTCVFSIVSTRLRQRSTGQLACPRTEETSKGS